MAKEVYLICPVCGKAFLRTSNSQKFCSVNCKQVAIMKKKETERAQLKGRVFRCFCCGKLFNADQKRKYCSPECRKKASGKVADCSKAFRNKESGKVAGGSKGKRKTQSLSEMAKIAREEGLSYGKYFEKYGYEKESKK